MKKQWMIAAKPENYQDLCAKLKKEPIEITGQLDAIYTILVSASAKQVAKIKTMQGVISIEEQGDVSI